MLNGVPYMRLWIRIVNTVEKETVSCHQDLPGAVSERRAAAPPSETGAKEAAVGRRE
jgi:hypothetical protein